jgi:hypothetical protein
MAHLIWNFGQKVFGMDGMEFRFPLSFWLIWPKSSNDNGLLILRNCIHLFTGISWHSNRHFPQYHSIRHRVLKAVTNNNIDELEACLKEGWEINAIVDHSGKHNAATLAAHLDNLEVLHFLDLHGADLSSPVGSFGQTPLMAGVMSWNVRIIDYLTERGVDPFAKDNFGFTASKKAKIKNLKTIYSMLEAYEAKYEALKISGKETNAVGAITSKVWEEKLRAVNIGDYKVMQVVDKDSPIFMNFKPSDLLTLGVYPFSNIEDN